MRIKRCKKIKLDYSTKQTCNDNNQKFTAASLINDNKCEDCSSRYYLNGNKCTICPAGSFCPGGEGGVQTACDSGMWSNAGALKCQSCGTGVAECNASTGDITSCQSDYVFSSYTVSTIAGQKGVSGLVDGPGATAKFERPTGITIDPAGNLYVADKEIEKILGQIKDGVSQTQTSIEYSVGEKVQVIDGPFASFNGLVEDIDEDKSKLKVSVLISTALFVSFSKPSKP